MCPVAEKENMGSIFLLIYYFQDFYACEMYL